MTHSTIARALSQYTSSLKVIYHMQVFAHLEQCRALPDFDNYLALILARGDRQPLEVCTDFMDRVSLQESHCLDFDPQRV